MSIPLKKKYKFGDSNLNRVAAAGIFICRDEAKFTYLFTWTHIFRFS